MKPPNPVQRSRSVSLGRLTSFRSHKQICKHLNVGSGQLKHIDHVEAANFLQASAEDIKGTLSPEEKHMIQLFEKGQDDEKTIKRIKKVLLQSGSTGKRAFLLRCLILLMTYPLRDLEKRTNPLKILLEFVDANDVLATFDKDGKGHTALRKYHN